MKNETRAYALYAVLEDRKVLIAVFKDRADAHKWAMAENTPSWHIENTVYVS